MDENLFRAVYGAFGGSLTQVAVVFTVLGEGWITLAFVPLLLVPRVRARAAALIVVLGVTAASVALLKLTFGRVRPCNAAGDVHCLWGGTPTDFSFPSGHAAGSFAFFAFTATLLWDSGWRWRRPACGVLFLFATAVTLSRVYLGVHFPGDVLAGACFGALLGRAGARTQLRRERREAPGAPSLRPSPR